jgi:hypothetical protein
MDRGRPGRGRGVPTTSRGAAASRWSVSFTASWAWPKRRGLTRSLSWLDEALRRGARDMAWRRAPCGAWGSSHGHGVAGKKVESGLWRRAGGRG